MTAPRLENGAGGRLKMTKIKYALFLIPVALAAVSCSNQPIPGANGRPPGDKLYVTIAYDDPIFFEHFRYAYDVTGKDIVLGTLRDKAAFDASKAGWPTPIVVLDEKTPPPPDEPILRLTWIKETSGMNLAADSTNGTVTAEYLPNRNAKPYYLGVVSRQSLAFGPDPNGAIESIQTAPNDLARRDARVEAQIEMYLYEGLQMLEQRLGMSH